jgi:hypothetical protein
MFVLQVTRGGVVSTTVTVKLQSWFVAFALKQITLLTPKRNPVPEGGMHLKGTGFPKQST